MDSQWVSCMHWACTRELQLPASSLLLTWIVATSSSRIIKLQLNNSEWFVYCLVLSRGWLSAAVYNGVMFLPTPWVTFFTRRPTVVFLLSLFSILILSLTLYFEVSVTNLPLPHSGEQSLSSDQWRKDFLQTSSGQQAASGKTNKQTKRGVLTSSLYQSWSRKALAFSSGWVTGFYLLALKSWQWMGLKELERGSVIAARRSWDAKEGSHFS